MSVLHDICEASRAANPRIAMSEGDDPRVVEAALRAAADRLARVQLIGPEAVIRDQLGGQETHDRIEVCDPASASRLDAYADAYFELRKAKGIDRDKALDIVRSQLGFAAMMVRLGDSEGTIGGAVATTSDTVRTALQIVGKAPDADVVSSCFLMLLREPFNRPVIFADCGLILQPTAEELASIATASAETLMAMTGQDARIAMLSFSTLGSVPAAAHESINRIHTAISLIKQRAPGLIVDGEIQFDAAIVPDVHGKKAPNSVLEGHANVFVFPSLSAGNIGYKIAHRLGGATALGPILQGLAHPANDLSRGCSVDDVYQMIAITGAQAAARMESAPPA